MKKPRLTACEGYQLRILHRPPVRPGLWPTWRAAAGVLGWWLAMVALTVALAWCAGLL